MCSFKPDRSVRKTHFVGQIGGRIFEVSLEQRSSLLLSNCAVNLEAVHKGPLLHSLLLLLLAASAVLCVNTLLSKFFPFFYA